jgi:chromosome segregation ATPase
MAEEFKGINQETLKNVEALKGSMKDIADATSSANKQLQQQGRLIQDYRSNYTAIVASAGKFAQLQSEASKSASATSKSLAEQQRQLSNVKSLNAQIENLMDQMVNASKEEEKLLLRQVNNLSAARDNARELAGAYGELVDSSSRLDKSTMWFSSISEVIKDVPGLRKLSSPFEAAAKAARETTISNAKNQTFLEEALKTGKGLTKEKIKELGLEKEARGLTGNAAAARLKAAGATAKTESTSIAGLKAGFAELGPIIKSALGPLALISVAVDVFKFFFNAALKADEQITNIAKNLNVSKDRASDVRQSFFDIKNSASSFG